MSILNTVSTAVLSNLTGAGSARGVFTGGFSSALVALSMSRSAGLRTPPGCGSVNIRDEGIAGAVEAGASGIPDDMYGAGIEP